MLPSETRNTITEHHAKSTIKSKSSKKTSRQKKIDTKSPLKCETNTSACPITSKKELIKSFLKELLCDIIAVRENTSFKELTDSSYLSHSDGVSSKTTNEETMGSESKKSFSSSHQQSVSQSSSAMASSSERVLNKFMSQSEENVKKSSSSVNFEKQDGEPNKSLDTIETFKGKEEEIPWTKYMKIIFVNGNYYEGETDECLMHGRGIYVWSDGTIYEGEFKNGFPTGKGRMILPELSVYTGEFCMGYFHGSGILNVAGTDIIYRGQWNSGKKHGKGWVCYGSNNWYDGDWLDDMRHGHGYRNYAKRLKYKGEWLNNEKHGTGSMLWDNNDYYVGQWRRNQPHGYGEYTWNISYNNSFTFLINNWYKGAWMNGKRTGLGIMHFGADSGSKLVGKWQNDKKDGPGILCCGNGEVIACDPLFENDKPVHKKNVPKIMKNLETSGKLPVFSKLTGNNLFRTVANLIGKKEPLYQYTEDIIEEIRSFTKNILDYFEKGIEFSRSEQFLWNPLKLPTHVVAEAVNLKFYIAEILTHYETSILVARTRDNQKSRSPSLYAADYLSQQTREVQYPPCTDKEYYQNLFEKEEHLLKNYITLNLPKLRGIYRFYAKLTDPNTKANPVLVRLFLWQLMRDVQLFYTVSLVEADTYFANNPWSCTESDHNPFEEIYFWQYLQYLVGCSWLFHKNSASQVDVHGSGIVTQIVRRFLEKEVFLHFGKSEGTALREDINLLPIKAVYGLYRSLGEPHTIRTFLNHTCTKNRKDPPCYFGRYIDSEEIEITAGYNAVSVANNVSYIPTKTEQLPEDQSEVIDIFRRTLYTFRHLGRSRIIKCLTTIYPNRRISKNQVDVNYKVNFLEFHEILLLCAREKIEGDKRLEEKKSIFTASTVSNTRFVKKDSSRRRRGKS